jgi:hypothetical protein
MDPRTNIRRGMAVMSYDGVQMGYVIDVTTDSIIVQKGALTLKDLRVPFTDISTVRGDEIILVKDHAAMEREDTEYREGTSKGPVVASGFAAPSPEPQRFPQPHEPPLAERRAAGPGWDPLSVDEERERAAPRTSGPDTEPPTRY